APKETMNHCSPPPTASRSAYRGESLPIFIRGMAAATKGAAEAQQTIADLQAMSKPLAGTPAPINSLRITGLEIRGLEIDAVFRAAKGNFVEAVELLRKATTL